jgi:hypothetical protein
VILITIDYLTPEHTQQMLPGSLYIVIDVGSVDVQRHKMNVMVKCLDVALRAIGICVAWGKWTKGVNEDG